MTTGAVSEILEGAHRSSVFSAAACAIVKSNPDGSISRNYWFRGEADSDTLFDLASLTKPLCTAVLLLRLCEMGRLSLADPVADWLPECRHLGNATVFHLATHTSGLPPWKALYEHDDPLRSLFSTPLERLPGVGYSYSDLGYILLGLILERAGAASLACLVHELVFQPLGMKSACFLPDSSRRIAPTSNCKWREGQMLVGVPHDANATVLGGVAGHAGMFASMEDVVRYLEALLPGARIKPLESKGGMENLLTNRIEGRGYQSVGFFTQGNPMLPDADMFGAAVVGHSGFTGTALLLDPVSGVAAVLLTNRVHCDPEGTKFIRFRRALMGALAGCTVS